MEAGADTIRLAIFAGALVAMVALETIIPWRAGADRKIRWPANIGVVVVDTVVVRLVFPFAATGVAAWAQSRGFGLFNWLAAPQWLAIPACVVLLDALIYAQHAVFHHVPALWRLHRMHHADTFLDVTSGARFHPLEIVLSMAIKCAAAALLGAPPLAVLIFEILLNATAMFNHSNIALPPAADRILRLFVVTPDMHRVHHSIVRGETDSNFGFNLPWWDMLFGTYRRAPAAGLDRMVIGLPDFRDASEQRLDRLLTQPFRQPAAKDTNH